MSRRTVKIKARALEDAEVKYISLVKRGANRIPFRIMKSEDNEMIDLSKLFVRKQEEAKPRVVALVVPVSHADSMAEALQGDGFEFTQTTKKDDEGVALFSLVETYDESKVTAIKMSEHVVALVENLPETVGKAFQSYADTADFDDNLRQAGFFPSFAIATDVLMQTVGKAMMEAEEGSVPTEQVDGILEQYHQYVVSLVQAVPATAFKLEKLVPVEKGLLDSPANGQMTNAPAAATADGKRLGVDPSGKPNADQADPNPEVTTPAAAAAAPAEPPAADPAPAAEAAPAADPAPAAVEEPPVEEVAKGDETSKLLEGLVAKMESAISEGLKPIGEKVTALTEKVEALESQTEGLKETAAKAEADSQKAIEAVRGTVHEGEALPDRLTGQIRKDDTANSGGLFDTAFGFPGIDR